MRYEEAISVRQRQIKGQPVDRDELAQANRTIAHQRAMSRVFDNDAVPAPVALPAAAAPLRAGCISVDEWLRTLKRSESYQTLWSERFSPQGAAK